MPKAASKTRPLKMTLLHEQAAMAMAQGKGATAAAVAANTCERTIYNWMNREEFRILVESKKKEYQEQVLAGAVKFEVANRGFRMARLNQRFRELGEMLDHELAKPFRNKDTIANIRALVVLEMDVAKQAAIEQGEWNKTLNVNWGSMTDEQVAAAMAQIIEQTNEARASDGEEA
ncbi:MAG TPA: hypothetical protein PLB31_05325 [Fimbriimonadaceae bacterium]|mgnify:CR=1 FL=1|nr:hypothetical protein [Armatimonadota bacterium]HRD32499.1 hypothetical protein [Fimbriimonadaceae bacterium]HRI73875.1 hypothetical protein [Fimbriimonadaceae bacterium]